MKKYFYYERQRHRQTDNVPVVTHCLLVDQGIVAKGISKCSKNDNPNKALGRHIALQRAICAMNYNHSQMDKGNTFWKKLSHDMVFSNLTSIDKKLLKVDELAAQ